MKIKTTASVSLDNTRVNDQIVSLSLNTYVFGKGDKSYFSPDVSLTLTLEQAKALSEMLAYGISAFEQDDARRYWLYTHNLGETTISLDIDDEEHLTDILAEN